MTATRFASVSLLFALAIVSKCEAGLLTFSVTTDQPQYTVGQTINWEIYVQSAPAADHYGIATLEAVLTESQAETLSTVGSTWGPKFSGYWFRNRGTVSGSSLIGITVTNVDSDEYVPAQIGGGGPDLFIKGSYMATVVGTHTLTAIKDIDAEAKYFNQPPNLDPDKPELSRADFTVAAGSTTFDVVAAVPEPSTLSIMFVLTSGAWAVRRFRGRRRRSE